MTSAPIIERNGLSPRARAAFWISAVSVGSLLLTVPLGSIGPAGFIGLWGLYILAWPKFSADAMLRTFLPWAFPAFALASMIWSASPDITARIAVEWLAMVGLAAVMAAVLPPERLLASWMLALIPIVLIGSVLGGQQFTETGDVAAIGIFGSKNNFALHVSQMFLVSAAVLADRRQRRLLRTIALLGIVAAPGLLWHAKSVGALAVLLPSSILLCSVIGLGHMRPRARRLAIAGLLVLGLTTIAVVAPIAIAAKGDLLMSVGKSEDLTGRGLLWQRAAALIQHRPLAGVGYAAFWVQGNPEAEALWRVEHIPGRGGFHFHSFYFETLVELGYIGLAIGLTSLVATCIAVWAWAIRMPGPASGFFAAVMMFLLLRSFVELDLAGGFAMHVLLLPTAWIYATSAKQQLSHPAAPAHPPFAAAPAPCAVSRSAT